MLLTKNKKVYLQFKFDVLLSNIIKMTPKYTYKVSAYLAYVYSIF